MKLCYPIIKLYSVIGSVKPDLTCTLLCPHKCDTVDKKPKSTASLDTQRDSLKENF